MVEELRKKEITAMNDKMFKNIMKTDSGQRLLKGIIEETIKEKVEEMIILNPELNIRRRNFSYMSSQYSNDTLVGEKQSEIYYYQININRRCNYTELNREYYIQSDDKRKFVNNFKIIEYNMEKILGECYNGDVSDKLYLYLSMIIANSIERREIIRNNGDEVMEDFSEKLMNMSEEEYYKGWMSVEEDNAYMDKLEAREFGKEEGIEIGKEEANLLVAKKMLEKDMSIDEISEITGLPIEEIEKLAN